MLAPTAHPRTVLLIGGLAGLASRDTRRRAAAEVAPGTSPTSWYHDSGQCSAHRLCRHRPQIHELFFRIGGDQDWRHAVPGPSRCRSLQARARQAGSPRRRTSSTSPMSVRTSRFISASSSSADSGAGCTRCPARVRCPGPGHQSDELVHDTGERPAHCLCRHGPADPRIFFRHRPLNLTWQHSLPSAAPGAIPAAPGTSPTSWYTDAGKRPAHRLCRHRQPDPRTVFPGSSRVAISSCRPVRRRRVPCLCPDAGAIPTSAGPQRPSDGAREAPPRTIPTPRRNAGTADRARRLARALRHRARPGFSGSGTGWRYSACRARTASLAAASPPARRRSCRPSSRRSPTAARNTPRENSRANCSTPAGCCGCTRR